MVVGIHTNSRVYIFYSGVNIVEGEAEADSIVNGINRIDKKKDL